VQAQQASLRDVARGYWEVQLLVYMLTGWCLTCVGVGVCVQAQQASLRDMARGYWEEKRRRKERVIKVDGHDVLRENNYDMQVGATCVCACVCELGGGIKWMAMTCCGRIITTCRWGQGVCVCTDLLDIF